MTTNIQELLEAHNYDLSVPELQPYTDTLDVVLPCLEKNVSMIKLCGDRVRDNYDVAVLVLSHEPTLLWCFSVRLQTHPEIVRLTMHILIEDPKITLSTRRFAKIAISEGNRRRALCSSL